MSLLNGFLGGTLIGGAAGIALLGAGEIMGFSGIISSVLKNPLAAAREHPWKMAFLSTFMLSAYVFLIPHIDADKISAVASVTSPAAYGLSGLLVGLGTKLGNGCTSGHGICGMARLSRRSITAVLTFMGTAVATTVTAVRSWSFLRDGAVEAYLPAHVMPAVAAVLVGLTVYGSFVNNSKKNKTVTTAKQQQDANQTATQGDDDETQAELDKRLPAAIAGVVAAAGLSISTMVYPTAVRGFLDVSRIADGNTTTTWDPTLALVMTGGLLTSFVSYQFVPKHNVFSTCPKLSRPLAGGDKFGVPTNQTIDAKLLTGAALFGMGWGISGLCPGPALLLTMTGLQGMALQYWPAFYVGNRLAEVIQEHVF